MSTREGLNSDEEVIQIEKCSFIEESGLSKGGTLVITQNGLVFLKHTGLFGSGRQRLHAIDYGKIKAIRIETPGWVGAQLCIDIVTPIGLETYRYKVSQVQAQNLKELIKKAMELMLSDSSTTPSAKEATVIRETVIKEITLVVCPHCGHRNDSSLRQCEKCGASI